MTYYAGCYVEEVRPGEWAVCWPDCTPMERGLFSRRAALAALRHYQKADEDARPTQEPPHD